MTDAIARKHASDMAELISCYAAPLVRRAAQAPHGRGRRSRLRRAADACRFFDGTRASRFDDPRAEVCLRDAREALEALGEALRTTEPSSALETDLLQLAVERTPGQKVWLFDDYLKHVDAHGEHPVLVGCRAAFEAVVEGQEK